MKDRQTIILNEHGFENFIKHIVIETINNFHDYQFQIISKIQPEIDRWIKENNLPLYTKVHESPKITGLEIRFASDNHSEDFAYKTWYWLFLVPFNDKYMECRGYTGERLLKISDIKKELDKQLYAYRQQTSYM